MDGDIVMHADKINADHIPVKGLLHVFGEDLADLIKKGTDAGWREGEDIIPMPEAMMPPPHIHGRVTRVAIEGSKIVQYTDSGLHFAALRPPQAHRGGNVTIRHVDQCRLPISRSSATGRLFDFF